MARLARIAVGFFSLMKVVSLVKSPQRESGRELATTAVASVGNCQERNAGGRETDAT